MTACLQDKNIERQLEDMGFKQQIKPYTGFEIIAQMPSGTRIETLSLAFWRVTFPVTQHYDDFREDANPHKAAALAFIAWKKGLQ